MRKDIVKFLTKLHERYGLSAYYNVHKDLYMIHKNGYAIQGFSTAQFYTMPKTKRIENIIGILQRGLTHNIGEKSIKENLHVRVKHGTKIC